MLARKTQNIIIPARQAHGLVGWQTRGLATAVNASLKAPLSRFEPDEVQDYSIFLDKVSKFKKMFGLPVHSQLLNLILCLITESDC